ncbi:hypothetical protein OIU77_020287 [Salix suchowensis]|uniref:Uncharacterized protein n=1 Tax=Salix suchowensis TaxID=1278906 RepID=A0ABQ9CNY5_9ROSI|nr:hypothetical protein OIU77_020287 [Salix suchowensis]
MAACHVRSISLPSRSHPLNASVEDQLDRLRSSLTASTSAYHKLSGLKALYECVEDFLQLPSTQQTLSNEQQKERGEEVLNGSLLLLDMCSTTRDVFSSMKECLQELESSLRRRKGGESGFSSEVESYMIQRPDQAPMAGLSFQNYFNPNVYHATAEASELEKIDAELLVLKSSKDINPVQVQNVLKGLVAFESDIQEAEEELEAAYRKLLKTRVTILNILSH